MPTARTKANRKYNEKTYDRVEFTVPKGQKQVLIDYATSQGKSLNAFVKEAVYNAMNIRDQGE